VALVEDRPGFPAEHDLGGGPRPLTSLNPMARAASLAGEPPSSAAVESAAPAALRQAPVSSPPRPSVGTLSYVSPDRLWADELAFAAWLQTNLSALADALGVTLSSGRMPQPETPVVLAGDGSGGVAVIVCELHDATDEGFGRLVRNVAASGARHAIWICGDPGQEYGASVSWLNRAVDSRVSMVKISAVTIGESSAAPMFEVKVRTPRARDDGVEASVPAAGAVSGTRRVDDWLNSVGAGDEQG
jgi:hypothetical protein